MAGYVNVYAVYRLLSVSNSQPVEASSFCDFWKLTFCEFIAFISSLIEVNFLFMLIKDKFT